jgi:hypothetical protein
MTTEDMRTVLAFVAPALAVYAGIRADLRAIHAKVDSAHERIDNITDGGSHGKETPHASA